MHWEHFNSIQEIFVGDETVNASPTIASSITNTRAENIELSEDVNPIPDAVEKVEEETPTAIPTPKRRDISVKGKGAKALYLQRKTIIEMEKERIAILAKIAKQLESSNEIQQQRNLLLEKYINIMDKK